MSLINAEVGQTVEVLRVSLPQAASKRLEAIGLFSGTALGVLAKKRSAVVVAVRGARFALGRSVAEGVEVNGIG